MKLNVLFGISTALLLFRAIAPALGAAPPPNDSYSNAQPLSGSPVEFEVTLEGATAEVGEPDHLVYGSGSPSVWFAWTAPGSGEALLEVLTDGAFTHPSLLPRVFPGSRRVVQPSIGIYQAPSLATAKLLDFNLVDSNYRTCVFRAEAGQVYHVVAWAHTPERYRARMTLTNFPVILKQPQDLDLSVPEYVTEGAMLNVIAVDGPLTTGTNLPFSAWGPSLKYSWMTQSGIALRGRTNSYCYFETTDVLPWGNLVAVISGRSGTVTSAVARVTNTSSATTPRLQARLAANRREVTMDIEFDDHGRFYELQETTYFEGWKPAAVFEGFCGRTGVTRSHPGMKSVSIPVSGERRFFRMIPHRKLHPLIFNSMRIIEIRKQEWARERRRGIGDVASVSDIFPPGSVDTHWENGGLGPPRVGETYNFNSYDICVSATFPLTVFGGVTYLLETF